MAEHCQRYRFGQCGLRRRLYFGRTILPRLTASLWTGRADRAIRGSHNLREHPSLQPLPRRLN